MAFFLVVFYFIVLTMEQLFHLHNSQPTTPAQTVRLLTCIWEAIIENFG